jgi:hypothetical protein
VWRYPEGDQLTIVAADPISDPGCQPAHAGTAEGATPAPGVTVFPPGPCGGEDCLARFEGSIPDSGALAFHIAAEDFYSVSWFLHPDPGSPCNLTALSLISPDGKEIMPRVEMMQGQTTISTTLKPGDYVFRLGVSGCFWRVIVHKSPSPY